MGVCIKLEKGSSVKDYENKLFFFTSFCEFFLLYWGDDTMYDVSSSSFFNWSDYTNSNLKYSARKWRENKKHAAEYYRILSNGNFI